MTISELRKEYHAQICKEIIRIRQDQKKGEFPNFADGDSKPSKAYAWGITNRIGCPPNFEGISGQRAGRQFEIITKDFIEAVFSRLRHLRPGEWQYSTGRPISEFVQYEHLAYIDKVFKNDPKLGSAFGGSYIVRPDIVVGKEPLPDEEIDRSGILGDDSGAYAKLTPLRADNFETEPLSALHAVISCKWTIRTDRAQNTRTEVLNLIRNRKGHLPHIVAVTAEPWPNRIAALALGTGDLDCVYHFALTELQETVQEIGNEDSLGLLKMMVDGRRLRDISDLPFDLAL